ncbi:hypothetical protein BHE74_00050049 [Ensete ventricosum]|nr:hypothetical protein BHE74_00050049 [Ensete ventricosum]RZS24300.1 hypothetical protein BHM03_00057344 [Ensete ventricosum]
MLPGRTHVGCQPGLDYSTTDDGRLAMWLNGCGTVRGPRNPKKVYPWLRQVGRANLPPEKPTRGRDQTTTPSVQGDELAYTENLLGLTHQSTL